VPLTLVFCVGAILIIAGRQRRFLSDSVSVTDLDAAMLRLYVECNVEALDCRGPRLCAFEKNDGNLVF
jgi:hypothetical protein